MDALISLTTFVLLMSIGFFAGTAVERRHFARLRERESATATFPALTFRTLPEGWVPADTGMVLGSAVVSVDYFKRFLAGLRMLAGGRLKSYEPLLDRGRREAMLRMKEAAIAQGYDTVINVRLETSRLAAGQGDSGTAGVEMLAYGTGVRINRDS